MKYEFPRLGKMRILVTQKCNLDCIYCHKEGQFTKRKQIKLDEFKKLTEIAYEFGVDEIKYSGGEPLIFKGIEKLIESSKILEVPKISLTTNGILLEEKVKDLYDAGLDELSISLDTLNEETFMNLNKGRKDNLTKILRGIKKSKEYNFHKINLNMTLTSYNVNELESMLSFSRDMKIPLRIISFIPLSTQHKKNIYADAYEIFNNLKKYAVKIDKNPSSPAYTTLTFKDNSKVCFVDSSCSDCDFCGKSYALRLTSSGRLKPCLISEKGEIDVITSLRKKDYKDLRYRFAQAIAIKKLGLMKFFDIPIKSLSVPLLSEEL